jgi:hypothetical protein
MNAIGRWHDDLGMHATAQRARSITRTRRQVIAGGATAAGAILAACESLPAQHAHLVPQRQQLRVAGAARRRANEEEIKQEAYERRDQGQEHRQSILAR